MLKYKVKTSLSLPIFLLYFLLFSFSACSQKKPNFHLNSCPAINPLSLDEEVLNYQELVEETLAIRKRSINYMKDFNNSKPLTGEQINNIRLFTKKHLALRKEFYHYIDKYSCLMKEDRDSNLVLKNRLKAGMIALSSALVLYDNYLLAISHYEKNKKLRQFINSEDLGYGLKKDSLTKVTDNYASQGHRKQMVSALKYYKRHIKQVNNIEDDNALVYLQQLIEQSPSYQNSKSWSANLWPKITGHKIKDDAQSLFNITLNLFSKIFGNSVGLVETRKGKLYQSKKISSYIKSSLKSGDILLEKTPFRLTDSLIPGHWGHAAIYVGSIDELKELGIWEHPLVKKYQQEIRANKYVAEALRDGVQLNTMEHFLNIDDFAALRYIKESREEKAKRIILTLRQLGKEYDFNFDVETSDKIVCSELIYITSTTIDWKTDKLLGRHTISPDNVAIKAVGDKPDFSIVSLIHDGKIIKEHKRKFMKNLLGIKQ